MIPGLDPVNRSAQEWIRPDRGNARGNTAIGEQASPRDGLQPGPRTPSAPTTPSDCIHTTQGGSRLQRS